MRVRLASVTQDGVNIRPLSEEAQNVVGADDAAEWRWSIGAATPGSYGLVLKVDVEQQSSDVPLETWEFDLTLQVKGSWHDSAESWWDKFGGLVAAISGAAAGLAGIVAFLLVAPKRLIHRRERRRLDKAAQENEKVAREAEEADERYRQTGYR